MNLDNYFMKKLYVSFWIVSNNGIYIKLWTLSLLLQLPPSQEKIAKTCPHYPYNMSGPDWVSSSSLTNKGAQGQVISSWVEVEYDLDQAKC